MLKELRPSLTLLALFIGMTGFGYPLLTLKTGQALFPDQANGSLITASDKIIGSRLIGQNFSGEGYFHPRPSNAGQSYDAANSSGSNAAIASNDFVKTVSDRIEALKNTKGGARIPADLATASGSGLDPDISIDAAIYQVARVAEARGISAPTLEELIKSTTTPPQFGFIGTPRVNVLDLNRKLDQIAPAPETTPASTPAP